MKRSLTLIAVITGVAGFGINVPADPPSNSSKQSANKTAKISTTATRTSHDAVQSANGWTNIKGEWVHPDGYKFVNGKILRTTARPGRTVPTPPGKLALAHPDQVTPEAVAASEVATKSTAEKTASDKASERARNLAPRPAPQTGSNIY
jgi:hypothetical protein